MRTLVAIVMMVSMCAPALAAEPNQDGDAHLLQAKALFDTYVRLEHAFDPAMADLYSDDAVIRNKRTYPTGQVRELVIPVKQYKELIRKSMPLAKERGDVSTYSSITYLAEGAGFRIKADRFSELKKYRSPVSIWTKPSASGNWLIFEELRESQP